MNKVAGFAVLLLDARTCLGKTQTANELATSTETVVGTVSAIRLRDEESGFSIFELTADGVRDPVTVRGVAPLVAEGQGVSAIGHWTTHPRFGKQFDASKIALSMPSGDDTLARYLSSGIITGVGEHFAKKLIKIFGAKRLVQILDGRQSMVLSGVKGIGAKRCYALFESWHAHRQIRTIMEFLLQHGVGPSRAMRIHKRYGKDAVSRIASNPYTLARDISGIGFIKADEIAQRLGVTHVSGIRIEAGLVHVLTTYAERNGHCAVPVTLLIDDCAKLLKVPPESIGPCLEEGETKNLFVRDVIDDVPYVYLPRLYWAEVGVARELARLTAGVPSWNGMDVERVVAKYVTGLRRPLSTSQCAALKLILSRKVTVLTGGPGVGKSTLVRSVLEILHDRSVCVAAPTGRAARRLQEITGYDASTIHRLLAVDKSTGEFVRSNDSPLNVDLVIIDELSMVDVSLMYALCRALADRTAVLFVGDADQLPSVAAGAVLSDLIQGGVPTTRLTEVWRSASDSMIVPCAYEILAGNAPTQVDADRGVEVVLCDTAEAVRDTVVDFAVNVLPKRGYDPHSDIQVLVPMKTRGLVSANALNVILQDRLLPTDGEIPAIERYGTRFCIGSKVIQTVNNYEKGVFNGDVGTIERIDYEAKCIVVSNEAQSVSYDFDELDELQLARSLTIHKSQGSEYPVVVLGLANEHSLLLFRQLFYTGWTRAKKHIVLVCQRTALTRAVQTTSAGRRITHLAHRLRHEFTNRTAIKH